MRPAARSHGRLRTLGILGLLVGLTTLAAPTPARAVIDWADGTSGPTNPGTDLGSASYSTWSVQGERVTVRFLLPMADAERVAGSDLEVVVQQRMGQYLLDHLATRAGNAPCPAIDQGYDLGRVDPLTVESGLYGFEIFFQCPEPAVGAQPPALTLEDHALFDRLAGQINFARIQIGEGALQTTLFTPAHPQLMLPAQTAPAPAGISRYFALGFTHLLDHWDHLCFLLGCALLLRRSRDSLIVVAGLVAGLALSIPASLLADLAPRGELSGSAIGLLVALLGAELLSRGLTRQAWTVRVATAGLLALAALAWIAHGHWPGLWLAGAALFAGGLLSRNEGSGSRLLQRALLPALFGFLEGFILPSALAPLQLAARSQLTMILGFDLGLLVTAAALIAVLVLGHEALARGRSPGRIGRIQALAADAAAAAIGGFGVFWMLSRLHG